MNDRGKLDDTLAAMFSNVNYRTTYLFYAHMIGMCSIKMRKNLPAAAGVSFMGDHYTLYINPDLFDKHTLVERLAILKHEMLHILFNHVERMDERAPFPWNLSTDCAINQQIDQKHLHSSWITPETLGNMLGGAKIPYNESSERYYEIIKDKAKKSDGEGQCQSCGGSGKSGNQCPSCGGSGDDGNGNPCPDCGGTGDEPCPDCGGSGQNPGQDTHDTWKESTGDPDLQKDMTKKMIEKAQTETIKSRGTVPQELSDWLELHTRKSEVNWKKVLRGIVGNKRVGRRSTIMRPDRRFPHRADLRGKTKDRMFNLLVIADVSGSMSDEAVLETLGEVRHICDVTKTAVDLIQIDTQAYEPEKLEKKTKLVERKGCGGTTLFPAIALAKEKRIDFQAVVVLTDGGLWEGDLENFEAMGKKVIWLIEPRGMILDGMDRGRMRAFKLKGEGDE